MATTVGQHAVATFTSPVNGTSPIDANSVRGNDNTLRSGYNDHDADAGIHLQSSALASRPAAGESGRKWMTTDTGAVRIFFDTGSAWSEVAYLSSAGGTVSGNLSVTGTLGVTGLLTASGGVSGNVTGNVTGNASTATALQTARTINGTSFDGTANITITANTPNALTAGSYLTSGGTFDGSAARTFAVDATSANTASKIVARDANGDFSAGVINANLNGNASTVTDGVYITGSYSNPSWITALAGSKITGDIAGNAGTATALATARTINGVSFDGTANITVAAAAGTLTGSTLASGVTASSLTSVGTLTSLSVSGTTSLRGVTYTWPLADGTSGYVLSTNGSGALTWIANGSGGGGSGTVNNGTVGYFAYYPSTGTVVDDQTVLYTDGTDLGVGTTTLTGGKLNVAGNANLTTGSTYKINGTDVLSATTLGSGVTSSSLTSVGTIATGTWQGTAIADTYLATISTAGKVSNSATTAASANTASAIVARDASGDFSAGTITAALTGNASTATALQTARTINGTSFDGTANITVTAAAGTLTGTTLNSTVVSSSLTSVGTLTAGAIGTGFTAIPNSALANSSVTVNGTAISLGSSGTVAAAAGTLTGTALATNVVTSSLTSVGTIGTGVWQGTAISDTYLATISTAGKVSNSATTATDASTNSAIVSRNASGSSAFKTVRLDGSTSGTVTVQPAATAGTWSLTLPTSGGTNGQVLTTDGAGTTSWAAASGSVTIAATGTNASFYPVFVNATTGSFSTMNVDSSGLTYNPSTNAMSIGSVSASSLSASSTISASGGINMGDTTLSQPKIVDYAEGYNTAAISAGTLTLDISTGNVFRCTRNANITTVTISNPAPTSSACSFTLIFDANGTSYTITWPAAVKWPGGTAPTITTTNGRSDMFVFYTNNAGTTWYAMTAAQNFVTT